ncbi:coiled-coil domain-containing protein [Histomonas meleagridis]|uniref:coiled-coil domain-containing protein 42 n=1 Tax=Histomonas meleagridis TaxID=135588 RepID=UPI00355A1847|nr:coiled-coil domain-containing protein [Histomonas meleagridis]KAH0800118.1 coiled-coil domain-containing protein 42 [Histomonas meleagridis]
MQRVLARRLLGLVPESKTGLERLIDKKREEYDLQVKLDAKKQQHEIKMKQYRAKAEELEKKHLENQEEVNSKDQYVTDNWNKRQREEERLQSEEKLLLSKQAELSHLIEEHSKLMEKKSAIELKLQQSLPYKEYLDSVFEAAPEVANNGGINEIQGIVTKYDTLTKWRSTLHVKLMRSKKELQRLKDAMQLYDESSSKCSVEVDYQLKCIAQAEEESFKAFGRQRNLQETQANQNRAKAEEAATIRLAIENMYQKASNGILSKYRRRDNVGDDLEEKFNFVKSVIQDMIDIDEAIRSPERQTSRPMTMQSMSRRKK